MSCQDRFYRGFGNTTKIPKGICIRIIRSKPSKPEHGPEKETTKPHDNKPKIGSEIMEFFKGFLKASVDLYAGVTVHDDKQAARYVRNFYAEVIFRIIFMGALISLTIVIPAVSGRIWTLIALVPTVIALFVTSIMQVITAYAKYMAPAMRFHNSDGLFR